MVSRLIITAFVLFSSGICSVAQTNKIITLATGGNAFITHKTNGGELISARGISHWQNAETVFSYYVKISRPGTLHVSAKAAVIKGESRLQCSIEGKAKTILVNDTMLKTYPVGTWKIDQPGYVKIDWQGLKKSGPEFGNISELELSGTAIDEAVKYVVNNDDNYFYWGRRGPSVHLNYQAEKASDSIEWFYNEVTVPKGEDVIGSYFMVNGFGEGYFGIQVNSPTERRILFSVWSPFNTDNPKDIPADKRIKLVKKGEGVHTGEFGNEGSGGQSYLRYNWKADTTYRFLLNGKPLGNGSTQYSAWFYAPEENAWKLIASFERPATHTYLKRMHSFLENFNPETGHIGRKALYGNQWVRNAKGEWKELTMAVFTADATARKGFRLDYAGGEKDGKFYMRNCGFFSPNTEIHSVFKRKVVGKEPVVNLEALVAN